AAASDRAPIAFERAARAEAAAYRIDRALELVDRGLGALPDGADPFDLMAYRAYLLRELGRPGDALAAWRAALELATSDTQRCPVWIGIAAANRLMGQGDKAMDELDQAEAVARREGLEKELAEIFFYRGNMAFAAGRFEECLELHNQTLAHARAAGDPEWEASAQGGLLDAEYARGHMRSALANLDRCLTLCREHGLLHIEARNSFMAGVVGRYLGRQSAAIKELEAASALSDSIQDVRGAMFAHLINGEILIDMAQFAAAEAPLQRALSFARSLGNRRIELYVFYEMSRRALAQGRDASAGEHLHKAIGIGRDTGIRFHGPRLFALRARLAKDGDECGKWLAEGEELLRDGANAHNVLWFHRDAIDACFAVGELDRARAHGDAMTAFTIDDPLPWADFFAARCHALADCAEGRPDRAVLEQVCVQGRELELAIAVPELEAQLN
ncbi:MAG: tetratricopeptide repeat protein, partial [Alphaproteobacteria bacterium]